MIGRTISHYKIIEKLGGGGMGVVYKAKDLKLDRYVAIKFLPPTFSLDEDAKQRFIHEAKTASALEHNNICTIHEVNETEDLPNITGGQIYLVMSCYEGETLKQKIDKGPLEIDEAVNIFCQIVEGLANAHANNIIHRDIKPANIFITNDGVVKILDFGLAKVSGRTQLTKVGSTVGTVAYMSPEQTKGDSIDFRTDIWSLGVVLFEMLTGEQPFKGEYEQAIIYSILNEDSKPITELRSDIPPQLVNIINKTVQRNPSYRYTTISEIQTEMEFAFSKYRTIDRSFVSTFQKIPKRRKLVYLLTPIITILFFATIYFWMTKETLSKPVSIALLPLRTINAEISQDWFTEGMTDALITDLAKIGGLRIISRASVMRYKDSNKPTNEIAGELGVNYLIDGSIVRMLDKVRIATRLIDANSDEYIWGQEYERDFTDILSLQGEVAREIASQIKVTLSPEETEILSEQQKVDPAAYEAYLKGNFNLWKLTKEGFETAIRYFNMAVEIEPNYAHAFAGIALSWSSQAQMGFLPFQTAIEKSEPYAKKAFELDSNLAEIRFMKAVNYTWGQWKWDLADKEFNETLKLNPNMSEARAYYSQFLFLQDRPEEAMDNIELALQLDPFNNLFKALYAMDLMYVREYDKLITLLEDVLKTSPNEYMAMSTLRSAYHQKKMYDKALEMWVRSFEVRKDPEAIDALKKGNEEGGYRVALQRVAELFIDRIEEGQYVTPWQIATLYTRAGMKKEALDWFEIAFEANDPNMPYLKVDPIFEFLYKEPRYSLLLEKMGLKK